MKFLAKFFLGICFFVSLSFCFFVPSHASEEFTISYNVTYEANTAGTLIVNQEISLTNKLSNVYATEYSLILEGEEPQNIQGHDAKGPLKINTQVEDEKTTIRVGFNEEVVGKGETLTFNLSYEAPGLFRQIGQVKEITIPKLSGAEGIDNYKLTLKVPVSFGKPAYISPFPVSQKSEPDSQYFYFSKDQVIGSGIVTAFGNFQIFDFSLSYHLYNPRSQKVKMEIALPPDTSYQKILYTSIVPEPEDIKVDLDGNWLASFLLQPNEKLEVNAVGQVKILAQPEERTDFSKQLSERQIYLSSQEYWQIDDPAIKELAQKLKTPRSIYNFVVNALSYDYSRVREGAKRMGGQEALANPDRAICMEFTDLFITLARAAGIPARELNGFAYTTNAYLRPLSLVQDVLHSWPEYWNDEKGVWIQIDPTWQNTTGGVDYFSKLDLGHFVFAIHGQDSQMPPPAGAYKIENRPIKDIQIAFGEYKEPAPINLIVDFQLPKVIFSEKSVTRGKIIIRNMSQEAIYNTPVSIEAEGFKLKPEKELLISMLPPFGSYELPVSLFRQSFLGSGKGSILLKIKNQKFEHGIDINSLILSRILPILGGILALILISFSLFRIRNRYLRLKNSV